MSNLSPLSPAAQAVLDAHDNAPYENFVAADRLAVAAALRAAANQLGYCRAPGEFEHLYGRIVEVDDLLDLAAELDGTSTKNKND